ncbi:MULTISPECIES: endonuclease/exonuclease/phosphatase family protein [Paenibacillus]|uniref:Endonuclease n=1 Tax=Paenibacillus albilobatus TaxID=2716884 RepID=A0A919XMC1_9BACL|nr:MULTISPECIES: endonuclease/exonuclease/phosphatase family protein [Paenibacillus]GIO34876.1 endonuclease [Paenibacillus albilobatus]
MKAAGFSDGTAKEVYTAKGNIKPVLRVLTYNIHHGEGMDGVLDLERIAGVIRSARPDLVALQEVDRHLSRSGGADQAAELGRLTGMHHRFAQAIAFDGGEYGIAILSKFPFESVHAMMLPNEPGGEQRVMLAAKLALGHGLPSVVFADTHLEWQEDVQLAERIRWAQADRIREYLKDKTPFILAGDMNALPDSGPIRTWTETMMDDATAHIGPTHPVDGKIDYILFDKQSGWRLATSEAIPENTASDHVPVLAVLEWDPQSE